MVRRRQDQRGLTTLLFTDIVGSSEVATELGDRRWKTLQGRHHAEVRKHLKRYAGHEVDTAGDGFFATFGSPESGVRCAFAIVQGVRGLGLDVRAGLHIGVAELSGEKVSGIAVTTASRVSAAAGPGQVLATDTIVHLVAGSGFDFTDLGSRELKGVQGRWELFSLDAVDGRTVGPPLDADEARRSRDRSSPPEPSNAPSRRALPFGIAAALVVLLAGGLLLSRDHAGQTAPPPISGPPAQQLVALADQSGSDAFEIGPLDAVPCCEHFGRILLTGRVDSPTAFVWIPAGVPMGRPWLATVNRSSGAVVESGSTNVFRNAAIQCVCVDSVNGQIWTATIMGAFDTPGAHGLSLRGVGLNGQPRKSIIVDRNLPPGQVTDLVSGAGDLWVGDSVDDRVFKVDPTTRKVTRYPLHQSADVLTFLDRTLWVLDILDGELTRLDPSSGRTHHPSYPISGNLAGMSVGGGFVWVADQTDDGIWRIPEDLGSPATAVRVGQIGTSPHSVAYDDGAIVVGFRDGTVAKINPSDPASPSVIWSRKVGNDASSITIGDGIVWVGGLASASAP